MSGVTLSFGIFWPKVVCRICESEGHTQISCPLAVSKVGANMSYEDYMFWCFVDPCDRPEGFA